jgi:hypothetical protein
MAPPRRRRFLEDNDFKAKRAKEEKRIKEYSLRLIDNSPNIVDITAVRRKGLIREWRRQVLSFKNSLLINPSLGFSSASLPSTTYS